MTSLNSRLKCAITLASLTATFAFAQNCSAGGSDCFQGASVKVCVEWSQVVDPDPGVDYAVSFSDALNPDIELAEGDLDWKVSSELLSNGNPANIGSLTTTDSDDYVVTIIKGSGPGAADVGTANLAPAGDNHSSLGSESRISGDLTGSLTVVRDSGGTGGEVDLQIDGDASASMTIPVLNSLSVGGELSGDVSVTHSLDGPLSVTGEVTAASEIVIADGDGDIDFNTNFAGSLNLQSGVPVDQLVVFGGPMDGTLDLDNQDMDGTVYFHQGGSGTVNQGGTVTGQFLITDNNFPFTGTATSMLQ